MIAKAMETWWQLITLCSIFYTYTFVDFHAISVVSSWLQCRPIYRYIGGVNTHVGCRGVVSRHRCFNFCNDTEMEVQSVVATVYH